jgi:hypothetical protein
MFIFYGDGEQVYKLHLNYNDTLSLVLRCGMWVNDHGLDIEFVSGIFVRPRLLTRVVLKHEPECGSSVRLDLDYVSWHLSSLRVAHF